MADSETKSESFRPVAQLAFHGELAELTPGGSLVSYPVDRRASIKDVAEALGVPHTEIHEVKVNGREADFGHILEPGQAVDLAPGVPPVDPCRSSALRPGLGKALFLVDVNVAKLAMLLRLVGRDALYAPGMDDEDMARIAAEQGRILLSRDRALLKRSLVRWGRLIRAVRPVDQLAEVMDFFGLDLPENPAFTRCLRCNAQLEPVDKAEIMDRLLPKTKKYYHDFNICPGCGRIYWQGSHHQRMLEFVRDLGRRGQKDPEPA